WHERARTDEADVATEDAPELGQLVHCGRANDSTDGGDPSVGGHRLQRTEARVGLRNHRAELPAVEAAATPSHARLSIEHRPAIAELHGTGDRRHERRGHDEPR